MEEEEIKRLQQEIETMKISLQQETKKKKVKIG